MSEIHNPLVVRNRISVGSNRPGEWRTLRLVVHRNSSPFLTVALIQTGWSGASALDARITGMQVPWDPALSQDDVRVYALRRALWEVAQTGL